MTGSEHNKEAKVLKRMLNTPHQKHEPTTPLGKRRRDRKGAKNGALQRFRHRFASLFETGSFFAAFRTTALAC